MALFGITLHLLFIITLQHMGKHIQLVRLGHRVHTPYKWFAKVHILLGDSKKNYIFDVRIVWSKKIVLNQKGYGVAFVNKDEVYNNLLRNL